MIVGNSLSASVTAARQIVNELSGNRLELEARLALGQPWKVAARPYVRSAVRTALTAQIESTQTVGHIALPTAMTGDRKRVVKGKSVSVCVALGVRPLNKTNTLIAII